MGREGSRPWAGNSVLTNFRQVAGERPMKIAPLAARLIDSVVMAKLRGAAAAEPAKVAEATAFLEPQGWT